MENKYPLISFLICSRKINNPKSYLEELLNSIKVNIKDYKNIEVLIKLDKDDKENIRNIADKIDSYPFLIRRFIYSFSEHKLAKSNDYMFLFSQRNPNSKYVVCLDDTYCLIQPRLLEELEKYSSHKWSILSNTEPPIIPKFAIISCDLIETTQNFGWLPNINHWIVLLNLKLKSSYKLNLWIKTETYFVSNIDNIINEIYPDYYDTLIEQQAKNIFLCHNKDNYKNILNQINKIQ